MSDRPRTNVTYIETESGDLLIPEIVPETPKSAEQEEITMGTPKIEGPEIPITEEPKEAEVVEEKPEPIQEPNPPEEKEEV
jgi:hypothetical protein